MTARIRIDAGIAALLGAAAALAYALSFHPDWIYDPLRYAELTQRGPVRVLLGPQHALGNLLPFAAYRLARALGYGGRAMPVLGGFAVAGAAVAVAAVYLAAVRLGGSRMSAAAAAGAFGATVATWRAGGSGGVYGIALAAVALGWLAAASYVLAPSDRRAAMLGGAAGVAVAAHLENVAFAAGAIVLVLISEGTGQRWRRLAITIAAAAGVAVVAFVVTAGVATGWSGGGMWRWIAHPGIGGPADRSSAVGWGVAGLFRSIAADQRAFASAVLAVVAIRLVLLAARSGTGRVLALAVVVNAGGAFLLSSWYQALRPDYWGLGLVPLAVGAGAGTRVFTRRRIWPRAAAPAVCVAFIGSLLARNASKEVAPSMERSERDARLVAAIEARVPRGAFVVASPLLAGRLADDGIRAEPGYAAVLHGDVRAGVYATSDAFRFTPAQLRALGPANPTAHLLTETVTRIGNLTLARVVRV